MIALAVVVLAAVALFGTGAARVALGDVAVLESQEAAQRAAEAAAGLAADFLVAGRGDVETDEAARAEAETVAGANIARGTVATVTTTRTSTGTDLVSITVTLTVDYGGIAGPLRLTSTGAAAVPRSEP